MKINKPIIVGLLVLLLCGGTAPGSSDIEFFPLTKDLKTEKAGSRKIASFILDEEIFAATKNNYSNLRIFDDNNVETPFLVRCQRQNKSVVHEHEVPVKTIAFELLPDNRIEVVLEKKKQNPKLLPEIIIISSSQKNYEKMVTVYAGNDRASWKIIAKNKPIFDYSRYMDVKNNRIEIKPGKYSYYKIEISNITESQQSPFTKIVRETKEGDLSRKMETSSFRNKDFRIDKIKLLGKTKSITRVNKLTQPYTVSGFTVSDNPKEQETILTFDTFRVPARSLTILTDVPNFSRSLLVEGCNENKDKNEWIRITSANISRISAGEFQQDQTAVKFSNPYRRYKHYRITIRNLDSPPLDISGVKVHGETHEALFFCESARQYRVLYGAHELDQPEYDIAAVLSKAEAADTDTYFPGTQTANPLYASDRDFQLIEGRYLMVAAILLMVVTLVWLIAKSTKKLEL
ncbi:hypothetical protein ACFLS1_04505 [Verrucomicrobiota bacterium]